MEAADLSGRAQSFLPCVDIGVVVNDPVARFRALLATPSLVDQALGIERETHRHY
jgi:hypothetical protein